MPPTWLIALILIPIVAWKATHILRYRQHADLFIKEVAGNRWIDRAKLKDAIRYYVYLELSFYFSLPVLVALTYINAFLQHIWYVVAVFLISHFAAFVWWDRKFSIKKQ